MARIPVNIGDHVGRMPMVQLARCAPEGAELFGKLEMFNPGGSVKDRIGVTMIEAAEAEGRIEPGRSAIVEAISTGSFGRDVAGAVLRFRPSG
jgi:cysteine synthase